jgi:Zn-dependent peptidase ImmA (M78 family)
MQAGSLLEKYLTEPMKLTPSLRMDLRLEIRNLINTHFQDMESILFKEPPVNPDLIGNILGIEFQEKPLEPDTSALLKFHQDKGYTYLAYINSNIDNDQHKRFSKLHECAHVLLNLFEEEGIAFRTPISNQNSSYFSKHPREVLCDIAASEMLFFYRLFEHQTSGFKKGEDFCEELLRLTQTFNASVEATVRTFVENYPEEAFMLVIKEGYTKAEQDAMKQPLSFMKKAPVAKPRIAYAVVNDHFNHFIVRNKSFGPGSPVHDAFYNRANACVIYDLPELNINDGDYYVSLIPEDDRLYCTALKS